MKVILLDSIDKVGKIGSEIIVKSGYARNFLFPKSKAVLSTKKNLAIFKKQQHILKSNLDSKRLKAEFRAKAINDLGSITITVKSSIHGKLFGSIGSRDIAKLITESVGFEVHKSQIRLPNRDTLKSIGEHNVCIHVYNEIYANLTVHILNSVLFQDKSKKS